ncbi:MAG: excinuclease ABC subunit UvrB [Clostridia bacterium]
MDRFELVSKYQPTGDQPEAITQLVSGIENGLRTQVLRGVTGSGKTFTMANIIARLNRPALVISHNKTLAAQLCNEFREFFPHNRVEFFVSYYDYYMPESYIPARDLYIEKELEINQEIDKLRHSATCSLFERNDVIVVASVSCIFGLGAPGEYYKMSISLRPQQQLSRKELLSRLVSIQYVRNDLGFERGTFRVRGDVVEIYPSNSDSTAIRVEFFGDEIEQLSEIDCVSGNRSATLLHTIIFPASHYVINGVTKDDALKNMRRDLDFEVRKLKDQGKLLEAQRLLQRTNYDIEMITEIGYCSGIENYSRYFDGRKEGDSPYTLIDYFPKDFLTFIDESHMTLPQIRAMYNGDKARKTNLVEYGFRMHSAFDNRPLRFEEFDARVGQIICVSATPAPYEIEKAGQIVEQIIRPTGLLDPSVVVRAIDKQIDDLIKEIYLTIAEKGKILVTTMTKKMAEKLTDYLKERGIRVKYLHSDIDTMERIDILTAYKNDEFDVLVGINLLREGLDLPDVQLVAILDADKEGFLRSETSLIQTIGRAARNVNGHVIMYADNITGSMSRAISETERRRLLQDKFNKENGITPTSIVNTTQNSLEITKKMNEPLSKRELLCAIDQISKEMKHAANELDFEKAINLREKLVKLRKKVDYMK